MPPSLYSIHHTNHYYITEGAYNQHQSIYLKQGGRIPRLPSGYHSMLPMQGGAGSIPGWRTKIPHASQYDQ